MKYQLEAKLNLIEKSRVFYGRNFLIKKLKLTNRRSNMADAILDKLKTLKKGVVPEKREDVDNPRLNEWRPVEEVIDKAREKFLADENLELADMIDEITDGLSEIIEPTEEEENEQIVNEIAQTRSKKLSTIGAEEE